MKTFTFHYVPFSHPFKVRDFEEHEKLPFQQDINDCFEHMVDEVNKYEEGGAGINVYGIAKNGTPIWYWALPIALHEKYRTIGMPLIP